MAKHIKSEQELAADFQRHQHKISHAFSYGDDAGLKWLMQAYHSQENAIEVLRERNKELREFANRETHRALTVKEAAMLDVCRVCRGPVTVQPGNPFMLNFGEEFAHKSCLEKK